MTESLVCRHADSRVLESRSYSISQKELKQRRRRECLCCGQRFSTVEIDYDKYLELKSLVEELKALVEPPSCPCTPRRVRRGLKLSAEQVDEIKKMLKKKKVKQTDIARKYGVSNGMINHIAKGRAWQ